MIEYDPKQQPKVKSQLTVVETIYHQPANKQPVAILPGFSMDLITNDPALHQEFILTEEWEHLLPITNPMANCSQVMIANKEIEPRQTIPTEEEVAAEKAAIIEVGIVDRCSVVSMMQVSRGQSIRFCPASSMLHKIRIRCLKGKTLAQISIYPE